MGSKRFDLASLEAVSKLKKYLGLNRLWIVHHIDFNHYNNELSNLVHVTLSQHKEIHKKKLILRPQDYDPVTRIVLAIKMTYLERAIMRSKYFYIQGVKLCLKRT